MSQATTLKSSVDAESSSSDRHSARIKIESPSVTAAAKKAAIEATEDSSTDGGSSSKSETAKVSEDMKSVKHFTTEEVVTSPTKAKL